MTEAVKATTLLPADAEDHPDLGKMEPVDDKAALKLAVAKLAIKGGDVMIVRVPSGSGKELMQALYMQARSFLRNEGLMSVRLLVLERGIGLETLNTEMMETYGWIRKK